MNRIIDKITTILIAIVFILIVTVPFGYILGFDIYYNTIGKEKLIGYNDNNYYYINAIVGSGRAETSYFGVVTKEDYNKWKNGESGTLWINKLLKEDYGYRINVDKITSIIIYDKENDYLPANFF